jgi:hypothetical protein
MHDTRQHACLRTGVCSVPIQCRIRSLVKFIQLWKHFYSFFSPHCECVVYNKLDAALATVAAASFLLTLFS